MTTNHIQVHFKDDIVHVELTRPECGNLVTMEMVFALLDACSRVPKSAKILMISGQGGDFCKGRDYRSAPENAQEGKTPTALQIAETMTAPIVNLYTALKELPVPTLSVVQGEACGFGCALAVACDVVFAGRNSSFQFPEMLKGLPPTLAMSAAIDRVGPRALSYMVYSNAKISSDAAVAFGLVSAVFLDDALPHEAERFVQGIRSQPLDAVQAVKEYLRRASLMEPRGRAEFGANVFAKVMSSR